MHEAAEASTPQEAATTAFGLVMRGDSALRRLSMMSGKGVDMDTPEVIRAIIALERAADAAEKEIWGAH